MLTAPTQEMVEKTLQSLQQAGIDNLPVLGVNIIRMQRAKNAGFPHEMYHDTLKPVMVVNAQQEAAMREMGYGMTYIHQEFPKYLFRRNFDRKFEFQNKTNSVGDFIEQRLIKDKAEEAALLAARVVKTKGGPWCAKVQDLEPLPDEPDEDPNMVIARLKGELAEAQRSGEMMVSEKRGPGRPKKEEAA